MVEYVMALMLTLVPGRSPTQLQPLATAIATVAHTREDAALLVTTSFYETTLGRKGIPFGISCCWRKSMPLAQAAGVALHVLHVGRRLCGPDPARVFAHYMIGNRCSPNDHQTRRARTMQALLTRFPRITNRVLALRQAQEQAETQGQGQLVASAEAPREALRPVAARAPQVERPNGFVPQRVVDQDKGSHGFDHWHSAR